MTQSFSIKEALGFSLKMFRKHANIWFNVFFVSNFILILGRLIPFVLVLVIDYLDFFPKEFLLRYQPMSMYFYTFIYYILLILSRVMVTLFVIFGLNRIGLDLYDMGKSRTGRLFGYFPFTHLFFATFIYLCFIAGGTILFVIPGIVFLITYNFFDLFIIDKRCGVIESLKKSADLVKGHKWQTLSSIAAVVVMFLILAIGGGVLLIKGLSGFLLNLFPAGFFHGEGLIVAEFFSSFLLLLLDGFETLLHILIALVRVYMYRKLQEAQKPEYVLHEL